MKWNKSLTIEKAGWIMQVKDILNGRFQIQAFAEAGMLCAFKMDSGMYKTALFPVFVSGNFEKFSARMDACLFNLAYEEGFLKRTEDYNGIQKKLGIEVKKKELTMGMSGSTCICTPSVNDFNELEKLLVKRIKLADETAKELDVKLSCIPKFEGEKMTVPMMIFSKRFNGFSNGNQRHNIHSYLRNSVDVSDPDKFEDFAITRDYYFPGSGHDRQEFYRRVSEKNWVNQILGRKDVHSKLNYLLHTAFLLEKHDFPVYSYAVPELSKLLGCPMNTASVMGCSVDEITAHNEILDGLSYGTNKADELNFAECIYSFESKCFAFEKMPRVVMLKPKIFSDFSQYFSLILDTGFAGKNQEEKLIESLEHDGYVEIVPFDKYLERITKPIRLSAKSKDMVRNEFPTKYGTNRIRELLQSNPYEEVMQISWENLVQGKRWIK